MWMAMLVARYAAGSTSLAAKLSGEGEAGDRTAGERRVTRLRPRAAERSNRRICDDRNFVIEDERRGQTVDVHEGCGEGNDGRTDEHIAVLGSGFLDRRALTLVDFDWNG